MGEKQVNSLLVIFVSQDFVLVGVSNTWGQESLTRLPQTCRHVTFAGTVLIRTPEVCPGVVTLLMLCLHDLSSA